MQVRHGRIHGTLCLNKLVDASPEGFLCLNKLVDASPELGDAGDEGVKAQMRAEGTFQQSPQAGLRGLHDLGVQLGTIGRWGEGWIGHARPFGRPCASSGTLASGTLHRLASACREPLLHCGTLNVEVGTQVPLRGDATLHQLPTTCTCA